MLLFLKKRPEGESAAKAEMPVAAAGRDLSEFIPYHCHFNPHTLLTKNGELMQIIKVASNTRGLDYESGDTGDNGMDSTVREMVRQAIFETVHTEKMALWIHTVRKRKNIRYDAQMKEPFALYTHNRWQQKHRWKYQYYNEIYITVMHDGQTTKMIDQRNLKRVMLPKLNRQHRNDYLEAAYAELDKNVSTMLEKIRTHYNAQRLSIVERIPDQSEIPLNQAIFYSEPMEFLYSLLNLRSESCPLTETDLSEALCTHTLTFGFNAVESKNLAGKRRFGSVLTLKQYRELSVETVDKLLQAPMEFIITQTFNFAPHTVALKQYKEQLEYYEMSGDTESIRTSGIEEMMQSNRGRATDFGEQQTSLMVMADDFKSLDAEVIQVQKTFAEIGLITIREDIRLEECFWAQLPGNFEFIRRRDFINTGRVAGCCRLNRFPNGIETGNHWGDAVTLMPTKVGSPYFFNFHHQDNGHTVLFDFNSFNDHTAKILLYFLLTETRKYDGRLFVFDRDQSAELYFDKLGGVYHNTPTFPIPYHVQDRRPTLHMNPFTLEATPRNKGFLLAWCQSLAAPGITFNDHQKEVLKAAIEQLYAQPPEQRHLAALMELVMAMDPALAKIFSSWHSGGAMAGLVDATVDGLDIHQPVQAFNMTPMVQQKACTIPVFSYLMHRIITSLDGKPTIIVLHDAWDLLENAFFAPRLESLMEMLKQNNVMLICTTRKPLEAAGTHTLATLMKNCSTRLYVPDDIALPYMAYNMGLNENDAKMLLKMDRQTGDVLLKQNNESVALHVDISNLDDIFSIFANDIKNLIAAGGKFASLPQSGG